MTHAVSGTTNFSPSSDGPRPFWTLDRVAEALASLAVTPPPRGSSPLSSVSTDTRTVAAGNLFVALRGERFDAHEFLADAVAKGATAL